MVTETIYLKAGADAKFATKVDLTNAVAGLTGGGGGGGGGGTSNVTLLAGTGIDPTGTTDSKAAVQTILSGVPAGSTVVVPDAATIRIQGGLAVPTRITFTGAGQLNFYNLNGTGANYAIQITADGTVLDGLRMGNPAMTQPDTTFANGRQQYAINVKANDVKVINCSIDKFEGGIAVDAHGEYERVQILGNRVSDVLGAGGGATDTTTKNGEDRGDGISVWGAQVVVSGNIVNCLAGRDARIGIHHEGLPQQEAVPNSHADAEVIFSNNIVYGQFRRGIATENITRTLVTGNIITDATWWGIASTWATNVTIANNSIRWTRTNADNQGGWWGPARVPIHLYTADGTAKGARVVNNTIDIAVGAQVGGGGIRLSGDGAIVPAYDGLLIAGNSVVDLSGTMSSGVRLTLTGIGAQIRDNTIVGFNDTGIYMQQPQSASISGNRIVGPGTTGTTGIGNAGNGTGMQIANNDISAVARGIGLNGLTAAFLQVTGNVISNATSGIDLSGCLTPIVLATNTFNAVTNPTSGIASGAVVTGNSNAAGGAGASGPLNNFTATVDPGAGTDSGAGYSIGSQWINVTLQKAFVCLSATPNAAVWAVDATAGAAAAPKNNFTATGDPGVGADTGAGYSVGSQWVNAVLKKAFVCVDATANAAVWHYYDLAGIAAPKNNFVATVDPSATTDSGGGYSVGSQWINLTLKKAFVCVDATTNAAVWHYFDSGPSTAPKDNFTATGDPGSGSDSGSGYSVGSRWINVTLKKNFTCVDATSNAAVWRLDGAVAGPLNNYTATTNPGAGVDSGSGYSVGSRWINTSTGAIYTCTSAASNAAVWHQD